MRIQIASDLHLDHWAAKGHSLNLLLSEMKTDAEVLVLAGDIASAISQHPYAFGQVQPHLKKTEPQIDGVLREFCSRYKHVVYVPGNHEFYGGTISAGTMELILLQSKVRNLRILSPSSIATVEGQVFYGGTGWQPYDPFSPPINDHVHIGDFTPGATERYNRFVNGSGVVTTDTIVVTHHAPSNQSISPGFSGSPYNRWFITPEFEEIMTQRKPKLWVHGHCHSPFSYQFLDTKVICNPRGYPGEGVIWDPRLVIEI